MSKKHFEAIASQIRREVRQAELGRIEGEAISNACANGQQIAAERIARDLATVFTEFNSSFDRQRFLVACGVL